MSTARTTLRDWFGLLRISNLPTVWSNVLVGFYAGAWAQEAFHTERLGPRSVTQPPLELLRQFLRSDWPVLVAVSLFYLAGMAHNDLCDVERDRRERPERPLPAGRIKPGAVMAVVAGMFAAGLVLLLILSPRAALPACGLVLAIVAYNLLHHQIGNGAVVLMGLCRGLVYVVAAAPFMATTDAETWWHVVGPLALILTVYTALLTLVANRETGTAIGRRAALGPIMMIAVVAFPLALYPTAIAQPMGYGAMSVVILWLSYATLLLLRKPPAIRGSVMAFLAGISLVDGWFLVLLGQPLAAGVAAGCFIVAALAQRWISGT